MPSNDSRWPLGGSQLAGLVRTFDWAATPLGPIAGWPDTLRIVVDLVLASPMVSSLACGPRRILIYNDAAARLYGDRHPAALGRSLAEAFPEGWRTVGPFYERVFAGEAVEIRGQRLDTRGQGPAHEDVFDAWLTPVRDSSGAVAYAHMTGFEVGEEVRAQADRNWAAAERVKAESRLRGSEEKFRLMVENVRDYAIFITDRDDRVSGWFPGAAAIFGWQADEIVGRPGSLLFTPEDRSAGVPQREIETARLVGVAPNERWHVRKDGFRRFIEGTVNALRDGTGEVVGFVKIGQDVTGRRMMEDTLRQSEERFRQFGDASPDVMWIRAADTLQMEYVNLAFERIYGTTIAELFQGDSFVSWLERIHPDDRQRASREIERVRQGAKVVFEYRVRRPDGSIRWLRNTDFPLRSVEGRVIRIGGIGQDVTEEKESIQRMNVMVRELHHRTFDLIGVVQSIVNQTFRSPADKEQTLLLINDRLQALSNVQQLLARADGEPIFLGSLIDSALEALAAGSFGENIVVSGPQVRLRDTASRMLALAIHELASNARRHGVMNQPGGLLSVRWDIVQEAQSQPILLLEWIESGAHGHPDGGQREDTGSQLIARALPYTLGGDVDYRSTGDGLSCVFRLPLARLASDD